MQLEPKARPKNQSGKNQNYNRGIKHDFPFNNIRKVPREALKTEGEAKLPKLHKRPYKAIRGFKSANQGFSSTILGF